MCLITYSLLKSGLTDRTALYQRSCGRKSNTSTMPHQRKLHAHHQPSDPRHDFLTLKRLSQPGCQRSKRKAHSSLTTPSANKPTTLPPSLALRIQPPIPSTTQAGWKNSNLSTTSMVSGPKPPAIYAKIPSLLLRATIKRQHHLLMTLCLPAHLILYFLLSSTPPSMLNPCFHAPTTNAESLLHQSIQQ